MNSGHIPPHACLAPTSMLISIIFFFQPYVDIETGALDSWPAHAAKQQLVRLNTDGQSSKEPPKPKFLDRLEKFLAKELQALDCTDPSKPSEKRLQVSLHESM